MKKRRWLWWIGVPLVLVAGAAGLAWWWMMGPLYRPGDVRMQAVTAPSQDGVRAGYWRMERDVDVFHHERGHGRTVLVIHGGPCIPPEHPWAAAERLAASVRFVYYHQRGCGESSRPITSLAGKNAWEAMQALNVKLGLPAQIADIERIRQLLGEQKLTIVGHSFGSFLAALYAAEYPEHVDRMVLVSPAELVVMPGHFDFYTAVRARLPESDRGEFDAFLDRYFDFGQVASWTEASAAAQNREFAAWYMKAVHMEGELPRRMGGLATLAMYISMGRRHDYSAALSRVAAPVLVIHGAEDFQPRAVTERFAGRFANARVVELPAGHMSFDEAPDAFAQAVKQFLEAS